MINIQRIISHKLAFLPLFLFILSILVLFVIEIIDPLDHLSLSNWVGGLLWVIALPPSFPALLLGIPDSFFAVILASFLFGCIEYFTLGVLLSSKNLLLKSLGILLLVVVALFTGVMWYISTLDLSF